MKKRKPARLRSARRPWRTRRQRSPRSPPAPSPRVRVIFAIPDADFARIASLKLLAKRAGFKVKKNELIRLGLRALQSLDDVELQSRVLALRDADRAATQD